MNCFAKTKQILPEFLTHSTNQNIELYQPIIQTFGLKEELLVELREAKSVEKVELEKIMKHLDSYETRVPVFLSTIPKDMTTDLVLESVIGHLTDHLVNQTEHLICEPLDVNVAELYVFVVTSAVIDYLTEGAMPCMFEVVSNLSNYLEEELTLSELRDLIEEDLESIDKK